MIEIAGWVDLIVGVILALGGALLNNYVTRRAEKGWLGVSINGGIIIIVLISLLVFFSAPAEPTDEKLEVGGEADLTDPRATERERTFTFRRTNRHCSGASNVHWTVRAGEGWKINRGTVKLTGRHVSNKSYLSGPEDLPEGNPEDGFIYTGQVVNSGDCFKFFGKAVIKDGRGTIHIVGKFTERRL